MPEKMQSYAWSDLLSVFFISVQKTLLHLCAVQISNFISIFVIVNSTDENYSYVFIKKIEKRSLKIMHDLAKNVNWK